MQPISADSAGTPQPPPTSKYLALLMLDDWWFFLSGAAVVVHSCNMQSERAQTTPEVQRVKPSQSSGLHAVRGSHTWK